MASGAGYSYSSNYSSKCPRCSDYLDAKVDTTQQNLGRKYFTHESAATECNYFRWADSPPISQTKSSTSSSASTVPTVPVTPRASSTGFSASFSSSASASAMNPTTLAVALKQIAAAPLRIFVSSKKDSILSLPFTENVVKVADNQLRTHKIVRNGYLQTGRFVPKISDTMGGVSSIYKMDFLDAVYRDIVAYEDALESLKTSTVHAQIKQSDIMFAVITAAEEYEVVMEIQYALLCKIPVFLKFCNCDEYQVEKYKPVIAAVHNAFLTSITSTSLATAAAKLILTSNIHFERIDLLKSWKSLPDYINYLSVLPVCLDCQESFSPLSTTSVIGRNTITVEPSRISSFSCVSHADDFADDEDFASEERESIEFICHYCLDYLRKTVTKFFPPISVRAQKIVPSKPIVDLVLAYFGVVETATKK